MAFEVPLPSVAPQVGPTPTIHEELPAEALASGVLAKGATEVGGAVDKLADVFQQHAMQMAAIDNKTAADTAFGQNLQQANEYIGKWQADNTGMAAITNLPQALKDLEAQRSAIGAGLQTPMAKVLFEQDSRRTLSYMEGDLARYANEERKKYILGQNTAVTQMVISDTVANPSHLVANQGKIQEQLATQATLVGWSPEELQSNYQKINSSMLSDMIQSMADSGQGVAAQAFLTQHQKEMTGQDQVRMATYLKKTNEPGQIANIVDGVVNSTVPGALGGGGTDTRTLAQIEHDESGGRNIVNYREQRGEKGFTASGYYQITDPTWREFAPDVPGASKYARAIDAPRDVQTAVAQAIQAKTGNARWAESAPGQSASVSSDPLGALQNNLPQMLKKVDDAVDAQFPGQDNAARKDQAEQRLIAQVQRVKTAQDAQYSQAYDKLLTAVADPSVDSIDRLQGAYPGANSDFQSLPATMQRSLQRDMLQNANQVTDAKLVVRNKFDGEIANDPMGFAQKGPGYITSEDIPPGWKQHYIDAQQQIIKKAQHTAQMNQSIDHALSLAPIAQGLDKIGIAKGTDDYNEFTGALMGEIEHFEDVHGRKPGDADLMRIGNDLMARQSATYGIPLTGIHWQGQGDVTFHVPDESKQRITQQFQQAKGYAPNAATIAEIYWRTHAR